LIGPPGSGPSATSASGRKFAMAADVGRRSLAGHNQPLRVLKWPPGTGHSLLVVVLGFRNWQSVRLHWKGLRTADRRTRTRHFGRRWQSPIPVCGSLPHCIAARSRG
jgi:hypothetical protein